MRHRVALENPLPSSPTPALPTVAVTFESIFAPSWRLERRALLQDVGLSYGRSGEGAQSLREGSCWRLRAKDRSLVLGLMLLCRGGSHINIGTKRAETSGQLWLFHDPHRCKYDEGNDQLSCCSVPPYKDALVVFDPSDSVLLSPSLHEMDQHSAQLTTQSNSAHRYITVRQDSGFMSPLIVSSTVQSGTDQQSSTFPSSCVTDQQSSVSMPLPAVPSIYGSVSQQSSTEFVPSSTSVPSNRASVGTLDATGPESLTSPRGIS